MTARGSSRRSAGPRTSAAAAVVVALGCGALAARPAVLSGAERPAAVLVVLFLVLLAVGALFPLPRVDSPLRVSRDVGPTVVAGARCVRVRRRSSARGRPRARRCSAVPVVLANALAAVAEEAWFRRLCFGLLAPVGTGVVIVGSTVLFVLVHVSIYGFWILPLDLAAGALFGWQRGVGHRIVGCAGSHPRDRQRSRVGVMRRRVLCDRVGRRCNLCGRGNNHRRGPR